MNKSNKLLSDIVSFRTYSKYLPHMGRRETLAETINRNMNMHLERFPKLSRDIIKAYKQVHDLGTMPSMRSMQFGGEAILKNNTRIYNCSFVHVSYERSFAEILYLLLCGTGVGFSVQKRHISQLPTIKTPKEETVHAVHDSIEGWADALNALMNSYFYRGIRPVFDFSGVRAKGSYLVTTGAKAPGPEPLKAMLKAVESKLVAAIGRKLTPLEVHDIICISADCVLAGGIRRAALISLFDRDNNEMITCKSGNWWEKNPHRARANNSVVLPRKEVTKGEFRKLYDACLASNAGEPGFFWTNDDGDTGTNPCQPEFATVLTPGGISTIGQIKIGDTIWSGKEWTKVVNKWSTGVKPVFDYTTTTGHFVGTSNHRIIQRGERCEVGEAQSIDWATGPQTERYTDLSLQDIVDGIVLGDGSVHKASNNLVYLCVGEKDQDYFTSEVADLIGPPRPGLCATAWGVKTTLSHLEVPKTYLREVPDRFFFGDNKKKLGFLRGLYSANGSVNGGRVCLRQTSRVLITQVQEMLSSLGIHSYVTTDAAKDVQHKNGLYTSRESYSLNITSGKRIFLEKIGFLQKYKTEALTRLKTSGARNLTSDIKSVRELGEFEVFDMTVECEDHTYWTGGCLVSNCCEISLNSQQFCNLTTTNLTGIKNEKDLHNRVYAASLLGTLQASYTDFPYLSDKWKETTEREALLGCSFTGVADATALNATTLKEMAKLAVEVNQNYAKKIGINPAARVTAIKPEGTASCVVGSSSGIHARHSEYYLRRVRMNKDDALARYLVSECPEIVENDLFSPSGVVVTIPQQSPSGAVVRERETAKSLFNRVMLYYRNWIVPGHQSGINTHNVSCTINYKPEETEELFELMWDNRENYAGISLLPFDSGSYQQAPFESCDEEAFKRYELMVKNVDLTKVIEMEDLTDRVSELACVGGACEIDFTKPKK